MRDIEVICLTPNADIQDAERLMCTAAKLTQNGHKWTLDDFIDDWRKPINTGMVERLTNLPHPTLQKFGLITFVIYGASRRFLAQITRHQNDVHFMSASLQYSDYSENPQFVIPYEFLDDEDKTDKYLKSCYDAMETYEVLAGENGEDHDAAGYAAPQGLRNILIMSATIFEWKHIISQRICRRNTEETRYVMLLIWQYLYDRFPELFSIRTTGCFCQQFACQEGRMSCGKPISYLDTPDDILHRDFPKLYPKYQRD